jgi:hypothetical protein
VSGKWREGHTSNKGEAAQLAVRNKGGIKIFGVLQRTVNTATRKLIMQRAKSVTLATHEKMDSASLPE